MAHAEIQRINDSQVDQDQELYLDLVLVTGVHSYLQLYMAANWKTYRWVVRKGMDVGF